MNPKASDIVEIMLFKFSNFCPEWELLVQKKWTNVNEKYSGIANTLYRKKPLKIFYSSCMSLYCYRSRRVHKSKILHPLVY